MLCGLIYTSDAMKNLVTLLLLLSLPASAQTDWPNPGNDKGATRYSPLKQIDRDNVKNLKVAWTYHRRHRRRAQVADPVHADRRVRSYVRHHREDKGRRARRSDGA
jgi:glucose dehydrogenase